MTLHLTDTHLKNEIPDKIVVEGISGYLELADAIENTSSGIIMWHEEKYEPDDVKIRITIERINDRKA